MRGLPRVQLMCVEILSTHGRLHAYEIRKLIIDGAAYGSVYQALSALLRKGLVSAEWVVSDANAVPSEGGGPPRKYFELTALGRDALTRERAAEFARRSARRAHAAGESPG